MDSSMNKLVATFAAMAVFVSFRAAAQPTPAALLDRLHAADWEVREQALTELSKDPRMLRMPETRRALFDTLARENKWLRAPHPQAQTSREEGNENLGYAEYYAQLLGQVDSLIQPGDSTGVSLLVESAYNPDSDFALKLASYGQTVVPALLKIAADPDQDRRSDSYEVLGQVLRQHRLGKSRYPLTPTAVRDVENRVRTGLRDPAAVVRGASIRGVKAAGDAASLPILEQLERSDPYQAGPGHYILRQEASEAIVAIKAHPLVK
jgi:hypothetical protein